MSNTEVYIVAFIWYAMITATAKRGRHNNINWTLLMIRHWSICLSIIYKKGNIKKPSSGTGWHCLRAFLLVLFVVLFIYTSHENIIYVL